MTQAFRKPEILNIARAEGGVLVEELAERFGVSVQTVRRDLSELASEGKLERVHGGAVLPSGVLNIGYEERRALNRGRKQAIAAACARSVPDGASLFLNIGTTTEAVARALLSHRKLLVVTNNINVANILVENADCDVVVAGGTLRRADGGLVGNLAMLTVEQFKFDFAVIGCSALDQDGDMLDFDLQEVGVSQTAIQRARHVFLVADQSKFQRSAPVRIGGLAQVDKFFTDQPLSPDLVAKCAAWQTEVILG